MAKLDLRTVKDLLQDFNGENVSRWVEHTEQVVAQATDEVKENQAVLILLIGAKLQGKACTWFDTLPSGEKDSVKKILAAAAKQFGVKNKMLQLTKMAATPQGTRSPMEYSAIKYK